MGSMKMATRWLSLALCLSFTSATPAVADTRVQPEWFLLAGSGESHPGWGDTKERVQTHDLILRYRLPQDLTKGRDWYLNRRSVLIEGSYHQLRAPNEPPMLGIYAQSCWTFEANNVLKPYLFVGGGGVYTQAEIPGTSSWLKGSYQLGGGVRFNLSKAAVILEYRFHHLSNGGIKEPNDPLNSGKLLLGLKIER
jgi:hypothetical protein